MRMGLNYAFELIILNPCKAVKVEDYIYKGSDKGVFKKNVYLGCYLSLQAIFSFKRNKAFF